MKQAGGILLAKTNLPRFSYWIESDNLLSGRSNNPWDLTRTPGGKSAAIAAGMSPIGLGTDLAMSVRGPAAQTGIVSLKATHGRVPMDAFAASTVQFNAGTGKSPNRPLRVGWMVGPGFGPVDYEVAATVEAAVKALKSLDLQVDQVRIPALEQDFTLDVFNRLHVMEMKEAFKQATAGLLY